MENNFIYLFHLGWYSAPLHIFSISWVLARSGVDSRWGYILNRQNPILLSVMKVICDCWRSLLTKMHLFCPYFIFFYFFYFFFAFLCLLLFLFGFVICRINRTFISLLSRGQVTCSRWWAMGCFRKKFKVTETWQLRT